MKQEDLIVKQWVCESLIGANKRLGVMFDLGYQKDNGERNGTYTVSVLLVSEVSIEK